MNSDIIINSEGLLILDLFGNGTGTQITGIKQAGNFSALLWSFDKETIKNNKKI